MKVKLIGEIIVAEFLTEQQQEDLQFFYSELNELLANPLYKHKYALIHDKNVEGIFDTFENAITDAVSRFQPYDFVIQQIISDKETQDFLYSAFA